MSSQQDHNTEQGSLLDTTQSSYAKVGYVSVIIPMFNEETLIGECLDSILTSDFPKEGYEVIVVDGRSQDRSREIVEERMQRHPNLRLVDNPKRIIPVAMNLGIKNSRGDVIVKMDAHASYPKDYLSKCIDLLAESDADNVGGVLKTLPRENTPSGRAIAAVLSHPFGAGNSHFRLGAKTQQWADTVFCGCYKRDAFEKIGLYNEDLARSSDMDLNIRLKKAGGKILLSGDIVASYYPVSDLPTFWKRNFTDGFWAIYPLKFGSRVFSWRHLVPLAFILGITGLVGLSFVSTWFLWMLVASLGIYGLVSGLSSIQIGKRERSWSMLVLLPVMFGARHVAYGLGSLVGVIKVLAPMGSNRS